MDKYKSGQDEMSNWKKYGSESSEPDSSLKTQKLFELS